MVSQSQNGPTLDPFSKDVLDFSIDPHCHLIPGIDDGSPDMDISMRMAQLASAAGIKTIIATPHGNHPILETNTSGDFLRFQVDELNRNLQEREIPISVFPGTEIFLSEKVPELFEADLLLSWADQNRFLLTELGFRKYNPGLFEVIDYFISKNITPIIAHPERYLWLPAEMNIFHQLKERGCRFQFNVMSINGLFGEEIQSFAFQLIDLCDHWIVGTDSHKDAARYWELDSVVANLQKHLPHIKKIRSENS